jgi:hypothetical protein
MTVVTPLHLAVINGKPLRFFRTPNNDGRPDLPWHCTEDLMAVLGTTRDFRRYWARQCRSGRFKADFRTVATADGLVTVAPHYVAQGTISAAAQMLGSTDAVYRAYSVAGADACKKLTAGLGFENGLLEWMRDALHRHDRRPAP